MKNGAVVDTVQRGRRDAGRRARHDHPRREAPHPLTMQYRPLGRTGWNVSTVSFGAWAIGGTWGPVDDEESMAALHRALDLGVNFFDTADVYGDGRSERLLARLRRERTRAVLRRHQGGPAPEPARGRGVRPREPHRLRRAQPRRTWARRRIDLLQLHCPPTRGVLHARGVRRARRPRARRQAAPLRRQRGEGGGGAEGDRVSRTCSRCRSSSTSSASGPPSCFFAEAQRRGVGILARLPLVVGPAHGQALARQHLRRRRPPALQSRRRGIRPRRDLLGRRVLRQASRPSRRCARWCRRGRRWRRWRCAGF